MRTGQVRTAQNLLFLLIFRVLKKLTLTFFARFFITFVDRKTFRDPKSTDVTLLFCIMYQKSKHVGPIVFNKQTILLSLIHI